MTERGALVGHLVVGIDVDVGVNVEMSWRGSATKRQKVVPRFVARSRAAVVLLSRVGRSEEVGENVKNQD